MAAFQTDFASHLSIDPTLSKHRIGHYLVLDGESVSGEDYISYTYSTASPESISEEKGNPEMQVCDGELVLKTGQDYIPPDVLVTPDKIHFVDRHFEQKIAKSARSAFISNNRIQPWHFP
ncbi:PREDICTED: uncharacterized protein LOC109581918 isoform X2 [Amphimedon queenslandica]|uniref:Uncharacterized protein n=1 Tax=Amphimedon queenslandica TaxID=400682 RepID=A0A1X7VTK2_AMPQE|nr:PREDICTED: uncharacterized protein LOC109581918 isoform X2 [Amphimedon queenslandica]|eukprot:XP_019851979.1 PREDICTED: uncharacterized protein LOC109581918 isoform X2 [Amphimedon queenslandica]